MLMISRFACSSWTLKKEENLSNKNELRFSQNMEMRMFLQISGEKAESSELISVSKYLLQFKKFYSLASSQLAS